MITKAPFSDLVILTADKNMRFAVEGLVNRPKALGIRHVSTVFYIHPENDPGCLLRSDAFLRPFINQYSHALVIFDREGCGRQQKSRIELESEVTDRLSRSGWGNRAETIVIDPELENWVFSNSVEVDNAIGWAGRTPNLRTWLDKNEFLFSDQIKPIRPKEALEAALRHVGRPRSSAIYGELAKNVGFGRCTDPAFFKLKHLLGKWFSIGGRTRTTY